MNETLRAGTAIHFRYPESKVGHNHTLELRVGHTETPAHTELLRNPKTLELRVGHTETLVRHTETLIRNPNTLVRHTGTLVRHIRVRILAVVGPSIYL